MNRINVMKPWLGADEIQAVTEVIESGWVAQGPRVKSFELAFAQEMVADFAVATSKHDGVAPGADRCRGGCE